MSRYSRISRIPFMLVIAELGLTGCTIINGEFSTPNKTGPETQRSVQVFSDIAPSPTGGHEFVVGFMITSHTPGEDDISTFQRELDIPLPR